MLPPDLRTSLPAALVACACTVVVVVRTALAPAPTPPRQASPEERAELAAAVASSEREWLRESVQNFPSDAWSQRDDFHGRELKRVVDLAHARRVRMEDVLRAIDDDLHLRSARATNAPDDRNVRAVPCKPRPVYD